MKKIGDKIRREHRTLQERKIPGDSFFHVHFIDDSFRTEHESNWSEFSIEKDVKYGDRMKTVMVSVHPIKKIFVQHGALHTEINVPEGYEVYQAIKAETIWIPSSGFKRDKITGRVVGLVKDGEIVEERILDGMGQRVIGFKM